jgi:hypothetical protein
LKRALVGVALLSACASSQPARISSPSPSPAVSAAATFDTCGAPRNKWYFTFCTGPPVTNPPYDFCRTFPCVDGFFKGDGYVVECNDGLYSATGGQPDACSGHGGVRRALAEPH